MTKEERRFQLIKSKAILELMNQDESGKYSQQDLENQTEIIEKLKEYQPKQRKVYRLAKAPKVYNLASGSSGLLDGLRAELRAIDMNKNGVANRLSLIPENVNCLALVQEVKTLRASWIKKRDEIFHVLKFGVLPNQEQEHVDDLPKFDLPAEPIELHKALLNARAYKSKLTKKFRLAKNNSTRQNYQRKLVIEENKIIAISDKMNLL
jgi:hypothetical protein